MVSNSELRARARQQLGGNLFSNTWLMALLVLLLSSVIVSAGAAAFYVGQIILYGPLTFGASLVFLQLVRGKPDIDIGDLAPEDVRNIRGQLLVCEHAVLHERDLYRSIG